MGPTGASCLLDTLLSKADSNHHKQNQNLLCYHYTIGQYRRKVGAKVVVFHATTKFFNRVFKESPPFTVNAVDF